MTQPIQVHFWPTPNGHKVTIALEEMGLPYEIVAVNIGRGEQFSAEFARISPNRRMPAIIDPEGPNERPISVFESGAILQYLGRKSGRFYPADERARVEVDEWLFWQMAGLGPMAGQANHFRVYAPAMARDQRMIAYGVNRYTNELHRLYGVLDERLAEREFVAGEYSIADMACWPWARSPGSRGIDLGEFPNVAAWVERVGGRAAVQTALAMGDAARKQAVDLGGSGADAEAQRRILFGQRARR
ncbi:MAG TPA: glutathione S-transferase N-terminal domain-containing protein [Caulobacteraceae bacterium]|jgi:glutathione S-transferase/GST-like protein